MAEKPCPNGMMPLEIVFAECEDKSTENKEALAWMGQVLYDAMVDISEHTFGWIERAWGFMVGTEEELDDNTMWREILGGKQCYIAYPVITSDHQIWIMANTSEEPELLNTEWLPVSQEWILDLASRMDACDYGATGYPKSATS